MSYYLQIKGRRERLFTAGLLGIYLLTSGCMKPAAERGARNASAGAPTQEVYLVKGTVKDVKPAEKVIKIDHEKIPGYMEAMVMDFEVRNTNELSGIHPGDYVSFRILIEDKDAWIDQIKRLGTNQVVTNAPDNFRRVREVEPLKIGDPMPNYHFTNEMGKVVNLSDFKGQSVAVTFLFTRCPFPTFCPRMSSNFEEAYKKLKANPNAPTNWHLLTLTFDPQFDTPAVLKAYAKRYTYDPNKWNYLTGELIDITAITEQFGLMFWRPDPKEVTGISHNLRTVVIDAEGRVQKVFAENAWKVDDLVAEIIKGAKQEK